MAIERQTMQQTTDVQPSLTALARAREPCEWERIVWAVLWDTTDARTGRHRHLCCAIRNDGTPHDQPVMFGTRREALQYIRREFAYTLDPKNRVPPRNYRLPQPYRVRVRITIPTEAVDAE